MVVLRLYIRLMQISAVIFDLDGTIIESDGVYDDAFKKVLTELGKKVEGELDLPGGIGVLASWPYLLHRYKITTSKAKEELASSTQREFLKNLHKIRVRRGFEDLAHDIKKEGLPIALATSNEWYVVEKVFDHFDLEKYFDCIVTAEEVVLTKPDPEIYLLAASRLGVQPESCLVFEDSEAGIDSAKSAGMKVVAVKNTGSKVHQIEKADLIVNGFDEIDNGIFNL